MARNNTLTLYAAQLAWREYEFCEFSPKLFALIKTAEKYTVCWKDFFIVEITVVENCVNINDTFWLPFAVFCSVQRAI